MDKLLYVAMSGAKETMATQEANNYNLANANTTGFKASLSAFQSRAVTGPGFASRAYATAGTVGFNSTNGEQQSTGNSMDIAVQGAGFIAVQDAAGAEAYTRAGDLHVDQDGQLVTASGRPVMGDSGPIAVPPATSITIGTDGTVSVVPQGDHRTPSHRWAASSWSIRRAARCSAELTACTALPTETRQKVMPTCRSPRVYSSRAM